MTLGAALTPVQIAGVGVVLTGLVLTRQGRVRRAGHRLTGAGCRSFFYDLRYHTLGDWSLHRWLVTLCLLGALVMAWIGRRQIVRAAGLTAVLLVLAAVALVIAQQRIAARGYIHFSPDGKASKPEPAPLSPEDESCCMPAGHLRCRRKCGILPVARPLQHLCHA